VISCVQPVANSHYRIRHFPCGIRFSVGLVSWGLHLPFLNLGCQYLPVHVILKLCVCIVGCLFYDIWLSATFNGERIFIISFNFLQIFHFSWFILLIELTIRSQTLAFLPLIVYFHGVIYMIQVIWSGVVQYLHGQPVLTAIVHHNLVHVGVEQLFLGSLSWSQIISCIIVFLDKISLLWVDLVWYFVGVKTKWAIPKVLAFSQVSHLLHWPNRVSDAI